MKNRTDLVALFTKVATEVDRREFRNVTMESNIAELGIDSLAMMQIVGEMELRLDVTIPDEELVQLVTVADLLKVVERRLKTSAQPVEKDVSTATETIEAIGTAR